MYILVHAISTQCHIQENGTLHNHRRENLNIIICCLFTGKIRTQQYFTPVQILDHFSFNHCPTRIYKIICLINHYNVQCIYPAIIFWFQEDPHLPMEHKDEEILAMLSLMIHEKRILQDLDNSLTSTTL